jgi:tetratricopeptide (TPR) repeat protein
MTHPAQPASANGDGIVEDRTAIGLRDDFDARSEAPQIIQRFVERLAAARAQADRMAESLALLILGAAHNWLGDERRAIGFLEQAIVVAREVGDQRREGRSLIHLGIAHNQLGNARGALRCYAQGLAILRALGDQREEGVVLSYLGDVYVSLGDTHRAWECYTQSCDLLRQIGDRYYEAIVCWSMGEMLAGQREYARAAELMQVLVDYERASSHADGEHHAMVLEQVRARAKPETPGS